MEARELGGGELTRAVRIRLRERGRRRGLEVGMTVGLRPDPRREDPAGTHRRQHGDGRLRITLCFLIVLLLLGRGHRAHRLRPILVRPRSAKIPSPPVERQKGRLVAGGRGGPEADARKRYGRLYVRRRETLPLPRSWF